MTRSQQPPPIPQQQPPLNHQQPPLVAGEPSLIPKDTNSSNHPLFLHQNDHRGLILISKKLIGLENYSSWRRSMTIALNAKNKYKIITKEYPERALNSPLKALWERNNDMIISWILNTVTDQISNNLSFINSLCQIAYQKMKGYWDVIDALEAPYMCTCNCIYENGRFNGARENRKRLIKFLMGLDESFANLRGQILLMQPLPTAIKAYGRELSVEIVKRRVVIRMSAIRLWDLHGKVRPNSNNRAPTTRPRAINMVVGSDVASTSGKETHEDAAVFAKMDNLQNQLNQGNNKRIAHRILSDGLYIIIPDNTSSNSIPQAKVNSISKDLHLWHSRLGHPSVHHIYQLDINNAFLHEDLNEEVYMALPSGYNKKVPPNSVCKLTKSLYGLKQANRKWFTKLTTFLITLGFTQSHADTSLFTYYTKDISLVLLIYVDDILITGNSISFINTIKQKLHQTFSIKDLGPLHYYLGIEFIRNSKGMVMTQRKYALNLIEHAGLVNVKHARTPLDPNIKLTHDSGTPLLDPSSYRTLDLHIPITSPVKVFYDNSSVIALASNPVQHTRTKHIKIDYHFVRDKIKDGQILPIYIPTTAQTADLLTKALHTPLFNNSLSKLGMCDPYTLPTCSGDIGIHTLKLNQHVEKSDRVLARIGEEAL
ncbi:retrovirus-related pol polyprotein from transposon TNT 1-94 [Tanacetum coccineum]